MLQFEQQEKQVARIKVIGVGGGGSNAVDHMVNTGLDFIEFAVVNTDVQALARSISPEKIQIGNKSMRGLGTGGNPELGRQAALDDKELLTEMLEGVDIAFITAGFGGGTGTGAAPVVAQIARDLGALTVGVITKPFSFEGKKRMKQAEQGLKEFREKVETIICIPNDKLFTMINQDTPMHEAYRLTDQILHQSVESISQVIIQPGLINLDFADISTILSIRGGAVIGFGVGTGKDKGAKALQAALSSPLLEVREIRGAKGVLISIIGGKDLTLFEVNNAIGTLHEIVDEEAHIIIGAIVQEELKDQAMVTLIATGLDGEPSPSAHKKDHIVTTIQSEPSVVTPIPQREAEDDVLSETVAEEDSEEEPQRNYEYKSVTPVTVTKKTIPQEPSKPIGFFEESDPTIHEGTNLDIPAFLRGKRQHPVSQ